MKTLHVSKDLSLPVDFVTTATAILAIRGAGKSYTTRTIVEEVVPLGVQTVIIDPTGVHWGVRSSADGKSAGLSVVVMGGHHGDVPLEETAGEVVAQFVVDSGASVVLDLSLMRKNAQKRFICDFLETLYHLKGQMKNQNPTLVIHDEADRSAPQKPQPEHARLLGAMEDLVRLGRSRGLGIIMVTQRPAVLNKDVLTQIETLIVLRTTSPQDRKAILEWVRENATEDEFATVSKSLSMLFNGEAWVWSPHVLKFLKRVQMRRITTFDSFATPKVGEKRVEPKKLAEVDLDVLKGRIAETVERAKANDPKALRLEIAQLKTLLADAQAQAALKKPHTFTKTKRVEVKVVKDAQIKRLEGVSGKMTQLSDRLMTFAELIEKVSAEIQKELVGVQEAQKLSIPDSMKFSGTDEATPKPRFLGPAEHATVAGKIMRAHAKRIVADVETVIIEQHGVKLKAGARAMLKLVAIEPMTKTQIATMTGIKPSGSTFSTYLGQLKRGGLIVDLRDGRIVASDQGLKVAGPVTVMPTDREGILALWGPKLKKGAREILETVTSNGRSWGIEELGQRLGIEPAGSTMATYLGTLLRNGLVLVEEGHVSKNPEVFA